MIGVECVYLCILKGVKFLRVLRLFSSFYAVNDQHMLNVVYRYPFNLSRLTLDYLLESYVSCP